MYFTLKKCVGFIYTQHSALSTHATHARVRCQHMQHSSLSTHATHATHTTQCTINTHNTLNSSLSTHTTHITQFTVDTHNTVHYGNNKRAPHWHQVRAHSRHCLWNAFIFSSWHPDHQPHPTPYLPFVNLHTKLSPGPLCGWNHSVFVLSERLFHSATCPRGPSGLFPVSAPPC